jgi:predicted lipoprotein with Yx(FWY)xxD motif
MNRTRMHLAEAALAVLAALVLAGCGDDSSSSSATTTAKATTTTEAGSTTTASGAAATVKVASSDLGKILVDAEGMTLYAFTPDTATTSACTGGCAAAWPPLAATGTPTGDGVTGEITVIDRPDGTKQVVVAGHPLYTFASDAAAGDTTGQGSGGKWFVVSADGSLVKDAAGAGSSTIDQTTTTAKSRY